MSKRQLSRFNKVQSGFSLIELVVVIIVLGVVSVATIPRFTDNSGFSEFAVQQQLQSALRTLQGYSMQDSSGEYCYRMIFDTVNQAIGPSAGVYNTSTAAASCNTSIATDAPNSLTVDQAEIDSLNLEFSTNDNGSSFTFIQFDSLGRPITNVGNCASGCQIALTGEQSLQLCVAAQGYVYVC